MSTPCGRPGRTHPLATPCLPASDVGLNAIPKKTARYTKSGALRRQAGDLGVFALAICFPGRHFRFWILDFGFWIGLRGKAAWQGGGSDFGFWISDFGLGCAAKLPDRAGAPILDFGFWILDWTARQSCLAGRILQG